MKKGLVFLMISLSVWINGMGQCLTNKIEFNVASSYCLEYEGTGQPEYYYFPLGKISAKTGGDIAGLKYK